MVGLALTLIGIILLILAWSAQSSIDEIGATNDPLLQHKTSNLENSRNAYLATGIGFLFMGLFTIALLTEPTTPSIVSQSEMISSARMTNETLAALSLVGNASYLPALHGLTKERIFIPATKSTTVPPSALSDDLVLSPGKDGSTPGILLEPFGLSLLNEIERELGTAFNNAGLEAAEGTLQVLKHWLGMMKDFHFKEREGRTVLRVEYSGLRRACRTVRNEKPDTCRQASCVGCACLLTAAARSTGKRVVVEEVDNREDNVVFTLSLVEW